VDVDIVFGPAEAPVNGIVDQSASGVKGFRWDAAGASWDTSFTTQTYQHNFRKLTIRNIDRFSWWGAGVGGVGPLPVALTSFQANCFNGQNHLVWKTQAEITNAYFLLEKSDDGLLWSAVKRLEGAGTSSVPKTYNAIDEQPFELTYYRLTQFDFDGKSESWGLLAHACKSEGTHAMVAPNPAPAGATITLTQTISSPQRIEWINAQGVRVHSETLKPGDLHNLFVPTVSPGMYIIQSEQGWRYPVIVIP